MKILWKRPRNLKKEQQASCVIKIFGAKIVNRIVDNTDSEKYSPIGKFFWVLWVDFHFYFIFSRLRLQLFTFNSRIYFGWYWQQPNVSWLHVILSSIGPRLEATINVPFPITSLNIQSVVRMSKFNIDACCAGRVNGGRAEKQVRKRYDWPKRSHTYIHTHARTGMLELVAREYRKSDLCRAHAEVPVRVAI